MKKNGILNSEIAKVLTDLGHTDKIVIGDCGLPVPDHVHKIDLALKLGTPSFEEVYKEVINDMAVEKAVLANEIKENNETLNKMIAEDIADIEYVTHEEFKQLTHDAKAIIRTGEATPYANVILQSNVIF